MMKIVEINMKKNPFDHNKFIGYVSRVTPELTRIHFPNSHLLKKFYFDGNVLHSGIVRNYVIIEGEGYGFLGRIVRVELPEKERIFLNESAFQRKDADFHPTGEIEIQLAFSIFGEIKARKGLDQYPPVGSRVYACSPEYLELFLKDFGKDESGDVGDDLLELATLPQDEDYPIKISANSLFGRHCAIVGTTGGGKSYTVAKIVEEILAKGTPIKIMLLDSTGEYERIAEKDESENITFGDGGNTFLHHKDLTESDLFALFRPSGQVQMPILQNAIKSLKLVKVLEEKKVINSSFTYPSYYSLGNIKKSGNKDNYETLLLENASVINSENADFDIEKLPQQIQYECVYYDADFGRDPTKWGQEDKNAATNSSSLITRIKSLLNSKDFALAFGLTSEAQKNRESFEKRILDLYFETNKEVVDFLKNDYGAKENYKDEVSLKVYNDTYAIIFIPAGKGGSYPIKFNIKDKTTQEVDGVFLFGNVTQSKDYEVYIYDTGLKSLKFGEFDFKDISNSKLNKNETYTQEIGFADSYETRIKNNILLISIYKKDSGGMSQKNTKLREVEYVLP